MTATTPDFIEGAYRVVSIVDLPPSQPTRPSPNRRRAAARIVFWNVAVMAAVVVVPILL
jgi:hypothetical protein